MRADTRRRRGHPRRHRCGGRRLPFRAIRVSAPPTTDTVHYAGTVDGLVGLIPDIESAGVADGVTLIPASPRQDLGALGRDVLGRLAVGNGRARRRCSVLTVERGP